MTDAYLQLLARRASLDVDVTSVLQLARWGFRLCATSKDAGVGSKIGGLPRLAGSQTWPRQTGLRSVFLAQIVTDEVPKPDATCEAATDLGASASLAFFAFQEPSTREVVAGTVIRVPRSAPLQTRKPVTRDEGLIGDEQSVSLRRELTLPPWSLDMTDAIGARASDREAYLSLVSALAESQFPGVPRHRLLGHPDRVRGAVLEEAALLESLALETADFEPATLEQRARELRSLLVVASEPSARILPPGNGAVYFCIDAASLNRNNFAGVQAFTHSEPDVEALYPVPE